MAEPSTIAEQLLASRGGTVRSDARRNLLRLVTAAREALDEVGLGVGSHEIARRAGVGIGTFYRQVHSLDELLALIVADPLERLVDAADAALAHEDPRQGLIDFATTWVRLCSASQGVRDAIGGRGGPELASLLARLRLRLHRLVRHAQRSGALRPDVTWRDLASLLTCVVPTDATLGESPLANQWERNLTVVLTGLQA
jgi:AcrR family transcriptional regulator